MRKLPASTCSVVYLKPTLDCAVQSFSRAKVAEIRVFADLLGITRYFACSMPSSTTQPISMFREPVHFPLITNGRCVVANEISSSEYESSNGQQPVKWHCSSEYNTVTETEVAVIVRLKQAFEDASHPIHPTQLCTLYG